VCLGWCLSACRKINDPVAFSDGITRSSAAIAYPRACRDYWRME
jgi:hypothetical protein